MSPASIYILVAVAYIAMHMYTQVKHFIAPLDYQI